jgi:hypothetical protein
VLWHQWVTAWRLYGADNDKQLDSGETSEDRVTLFERPEAAVPVFGREIGFHAVQSMPHR